MSCHLCLLFTSLWVFFFEFLLFVVLYLGPTSAETWRVAQLANLFSLALHQEWGKLPHSTPTKPSSNSLTQNPKTISEVLFVCMCWILMNGLTWVVVVFILLLPNTVKEQVSAAQGVGCRVSLVVTQWGAGVRRWSLNAVCIWLLLGSWKEESNHGKVRQCVMFCYFVTKFTLMN